MHEYLRVSSARNDEKSPDEQHADNQAARQHRGWREGRTWRDKGSASKFATKARGDFTKLVADLKAGNVFARGDLLALWESSRGSRRESEWHLFLDLLEDCGVLIYITSRDRVLDPTDEYDRETLSREGSMNASESARISKRVRRGTAAHAAAGLPYGRVRYGYRRVYDEVTRKLVREELDPAEAPVMQELYRRLDEGEPLLTIWEDYRRRGIVNRSGRPFSMTHLRSLALTHAYAGLRVYDPKRFHGGTNRGWPTEEAQTVSAAWPALVEPEVFWRVYRRFAARRRSTTSVSPRDGKARYLLSAIAMCGVCDSTLSPWNNPRTDRVEYRCYRRGCVRLDRERIDEVVEAVIVEYLADPANFVEDVDVDDAELASVRAELARARAEHEALADSGISVALAARKEPGILAEVKRLEDRERDLTTPDDLRGLVDPWDDVAARWAGMPLATKRQVARLVLTPDRLGQLRINRGRGLPVSERIEFRVR